MKHLLSVDDLAAQRPRPRTGGAAAGHRGDARPHRLVRRGDAARHPEGARAARQDRRVALLRGLDPDPPLVRDRGQAAVGRHDDVLGVDVVGEEGREPARHRADDRGDGRRRDRRAPRRGGRGAPRRGVVGRRASSTPATAATSTRPRRCSTRSRCAPPRPVARRLPGRDRRRHPQLARRAQQREGVRRARLRRHAGRPADADARTARRLAGHRRPTTSTTSSRRRRRLPPAHPAGAHRRSAVPVDPRIRARAGGSRRERGGAAQARHARHASRADEPRRRDRGRGRRLGALARHRAGRQRRRGAHGRAVDAARLGRARLSDG